MGSKTGIEWTDSTWNPIRGCSRVSEGCRHCYAETMAGRFSEPEQWGNGLAVLKSDGAHWTGKVEFVEDHLLDPLKWRKPRRIFVNSVSDLFHENVKDEWIDRIFAVMALCPQHIFQILTKRPERLLAYFKSVETNEGEFWRDAMIEGATQSLYSKLHPEESRDSIGFNLAVHMPLSNVWLGVSVEHQDAANARIPLLLQTPAALRFISAEPLLGLVDLKLWISEFPVVDWVICGGESGPGARPMHPDWARNIQNQCLAAGVSFFFKQWGEWSPIQPNGYCKMSDHRYSHETFGNYILDFPTEVKYL